MRESLRSVGAGGLRQDLLPVRLYNLAKKWFWDPAAIDFTQDVEDWRRLDHDQREVLLMLLSEFQGGEEAVTLDLLPLIHAIAAEGRVEEEIYLTTFLFEEAKHVEFFGRFLRAVGVTEDLSRFHQPSYKRIFYEELPASMGRLMHDRSPAAQAEAAVTYNIIAEGLLAETGYHSFFLMLRENGLMPGLCAGVERVKNDESRHLAWGIYHISRLIAADPSLHPVVEARASALMEPAIGIIAENFEPFLARGVMPFNLKPDIFVEFGMAQYQKRMDAIERSVGKSVQEVALLTTRELEVEE